MERRVKVSIVVLVYNLEQYLPRCLDCLVNQTLKEIEILCVDDGSTDSAPQIIDAYAKRYPNIVKAFHKENGGEYTTRNYGLERAIGEYVTFVDTDDTMEVNWAKRLYEEAKKSDADIAVCGFDRIDTRTNKVIGKDLLGAKYVVKPIDANDDFCVFINPAPWNKLYKRETIKDFRFLNLRCFSDMMFLTTSFLKAKKVVIIPEILYHYYLRYDSQIHTVNQEDIRSF
ncbi:MAG: glycosyltransferase [Clostridia bacterium]|nr:glycosyltransferase [Clostridia bacterium]